MTHDAARVLVCGGGAYHRGANGRWSYAWQEPVPGARDLTVRHVEAVGGDPRATAELFGRELTPLEEDLLASADGPRPAARRRYRDRLVVGLSAPELEAGVMLDVEQLARILEFARATVDAYRSRGLLPEPQLLRGRTPLWAAPVIHRWRTSRRRS